jgi:ABC-2 type transport system ATP-binding protein
MAVSADQIIVIGRGKFITRGSIDELTATVQGTVFVRASDTTKLTKILTSDEGLVQKINDNGLSVSGLTSDRIGELAFSSGVVIHELTPQRASLEEVFMDLTADAVEYGSHSMGAVDE